MYETIGVPLSCRDTPQAYFKTLIYNQAFIAKQAL